ncbi:MAG TPA: hypothetical protein VKV95_19955 [Terriglobia bacterium]|nr:hypothetical protein [Terriglobia bacterium]
MENQENKTLAATPSTSSESHSPLPKYEPPKLTVMDDKEVLSAFQLTVVATTWWVM